MESLPEQLPIEQSEATKRYLEKCKDAEFVRLMWKEDVAIVPAE